MKRLKKYTMNVGVFLAGFAPFQPMWGLGHFLMVVSK